MAPPRGARSIRRRGADLTPGTGRARADRIVPTTPISNPTPPGADRLTAAVAPCRNAPRSHAARGCDARRASPSTRPPAARPRRRTNPLYDHWLYDALLCAATATASRASAGAQRAARMGPDRAALAAWTLGEIYWTAALADCANRRSRRSPTPATSPSTRCLRGPRRARPPSDPQPSPSLVLDGLIGALAVAAVGPRSCSSRYCARPPARFAETAATVAYPLGDILVLGFVAAVFLLTGARPGRGWTMLMAASRDRPRRRDLLLRLGDRELRRGRVVDPLWPAGMMLIAAAAWQPTAAAERWRPEGWRALVLPSAFASSSSGSRSSSASSRRAVGERRGRVAARDLLLAAVIARMVTRLRREPPPARAGPRRRPTR